MLSYPLLKAAGVLVVAAWFVAVGVILVTQL
jgi:hypothetical protein